MTIVDFFANVAYLIIDIFAVLALIGSAILAVGSIVAAKFGRRFNAPEEVYLWSGNGLFVGIGGMISIMLSDQVTMEKSLWLGYSMTTIAVMLFSSILLLVVGKVLQRRMRPRRKSFAVSRRFIK